MLPLAAAMQGMDEKTLVASIGPMVQLTLIQLQNEAFTKQAMEAVTAFLQQPKSLTISAKPAATLKFCDFIGDGPQQAGRRDHQAGADGEGERLRRAPASSLIAGLTRRCFAATEKTPGSARAYF